MSTPKPAKAKITDMGARFTASAAEAQTQATQLFSHQNELMINAARALWDSQTRLMQSQAEQAAAMAALPAASRDPNEIVAACCQQLHESSERLIAHWRQMNDLMRDAHWQLLEAQAESLRQIMRPMQDAAAPHETEPPKSKA